MDGKKIKKLTHKSDRIAFVYTARACVCVSSDMILLLLSSLVLASASSHIINNNNA
jgi:hypothetical protein